MTCQSWLCAGQYADLLADCPQLGACFCVRRCDFRQSCHDVGYAGTHDSSVSPGSTVTHPGFANSVSMVCAGFLVCCLHKHVVMHLDVSRCALSFSPSSHSLFTASLSYELYVCICSVAPPAGDVGASVQRQHEYVDRKSLGAGNGSTRLAMMVWSDKIRLVVFR